MRYQKRTGCQGRNLPNDSPNCLGFRKSVVAEAADETGIALEFSPKPPGAPGFVPLKLRWKVERTYGRFTFFRVLSRDDDRTVESAQAWSDITAADLALVDLRESPFVAPVQRALTACATHAILPPSAAEHDVPAEKPGEEGVGRWRVRCHGPVAFLKGNTSRPDAKKADGR